MEIRPWQIGRRAELAARKHFERLGWKILAANWRCRGGELDLVAREHCTLVFVEVKSRGGDSWVAGIDSISPHKLMALRRASSAYIRKNRLDLVWVEEIRFDLAVLGDKSGVDHFRDFIYTF
jgi:putative endonuclease